MIVFESKTTPFDFGTPLYNVVSEVGLKRAPWTEICWTVRSILHNAGAQVGAIYIVYNAYRHAAPACDFRTPQVISMPQQNFLQHTILDHPNMSSPRPDAVLQFVHKIKGLRDFFIFSMDDIFLLRPFQASDFYDFSQKKILTLGRQRWRFRALTSRYDASPMNKLKIPPTLLRLLRFINRAENIFPNHFR